MNNILLFFALPIATIILAIVLQKLLKCPILVAGTFFAVYLIVTYTAFGTNFLIFAIAYTILAYITAVISKCICKLINHICRWQISDAREGQSCGCQNQGNCNTCNNGNSLRANVTLSTNEANPVLFLSNRNGSNVRRNCFCSRR